MKLSFPKLFFILAFFFGLFAVMVLAKSVLIPLSSALLFSFILYPAVKKLESWGVNNLLSVFLVFLTIAVIIGGGITLFSSQIMNLSNHLKDFSIKLTHTLSEVVIYINQNVGFLDDLKRDELVEKGREWLNESSGVLVKNTFASTTSFLTGLIATIMFTFLILIYREGLTHAIVSFAEEKNKQRVFEMLKRIQSVGKKYLSGMFLLILILGFANSIGLWIIGIDSPFLFGFLAALLSIIPYVGTTLGATIPVLYAFMSTNSLWIPASVALMFWSIQLIESNFLSPKIVGSSLNVNALVAILSLLTGAAMWGIAGMILFLPFVSILKVVCQEFDQLKPVAMLISNGISNDKKQESKISIQLAKIKRLFK